MLMVIIRMINSDNNEDDKARLNPIITTDYPSIIKLKTLDV